MSSKKKKKHIVHVNRHNISKNKRLPEALPVFTVKTYNSNDYGHAVILKNEEGQEVGRFVYSPDKPLSCGAVAWFESSALQIEVR